MITMQYGRGSDATGGGSAALDRVDYTSQITVVKGTMDTTSSLRKYGKLVVLNYYGKSVSNTSTAATVASFPADIAPTGDMYIPGSAGWAIMGVTITADGKIKTQTQSSVTNNCRIMATWVLE